MHDPIANMLTIIRNGQRAEHDEISFSSSKLMVEIARVLKEEGYINDYSVENKTETHKVMTIKLKYYHGRPVIERIKRISRPGLRVYTASSQLKPIPGFGIAILSTSKGVMTNIAAKKWGIGGEVLCEVA